MSTVSSKAFGAPHRCPHDQQPYPSSTIGTAEQHIVEEFGALPQNQARKCSG